jgi:hypothetical protein
MTVRIRGIEFANIQPSSFQHYISELEHLEQIYDTLAVSVQNALKQQLRALHSAVNNDRKYILIPVFQMAMFKRLRTKQKEFISVEYMYEKF